MLFRNAGFFDDLAARMRKIDYWHGVCRNTSIMLVLGIGAYAANLYGAFDLADSGWLSQTSFDSYIRICRLAFWTGAVGGLFMGAYQAYKLDWFQSGWRYRYGFGWTAATLLIPLVNFIRPWMGLAEIDARLRAAATADVATLTEAQRSSPVSVGLGATFAAMSIARVLHGRAVDSAAMGATRRSS